MTHLALLLRRLSLVLLVIAICATTAKSASSRERRHVEESSHRSGKEYVSESRGKFSSTTNNEITAEPGRKVSHRLIGGHLRLDARSRDDDSLWDDGILMSATGDDKHGKSTRGRSGGGGDDDDEKKTLSQQVKEGKYGLIQNEIYSDRPKRPGIISYASNPEVPKDTIDNLGGLDEDEIWLAENHVLVLSGGKFPEHGGEQDSQPSSDNARWPPIDDYKAPRRQVKIPVRPKVPPPFPVQFTDGGPIQIIGPNGTTEDIGNGTLDYSTDPFYTKGLLPGEGPFFSIAPNSTILAPDFGVPLRNFTVEEKSSRGNNGLGPKSHHLAEGPPEDPPPFYHAIPPGAVFVPPPPPPSNQSDYDEEDQSIYYPPPYSFHYPRDNTTAVPPGPLVPGIILPPPPDFFSALDEKKIITTKKYTKRPTTTTSRPRPTYLPPRKLTTKQRKNPPDTPIPTRKTISTSISMKISFGRTPKNVTDIFASKERTPTAEVTTETPKKPHTLENTEIYTISPVLGNQVSESTTQRKNWSTLITSKVPVLAYYPSTTQSSLERPVEVTPVSIKSIITTGRPGDGHSGNHASYYFYEESSDENSSGTTTAYHETATAKPQYIETSLPQQTPEQKKHYYTVETSAPVETPDYNVKLIDNIVKNSQTFHYTDDAEIRSSNPADSTLRTRNQNQRMLADETPVYYQPVRPDHPYHTTTPKPRTYYRQGTKPKPIYQYSFQIADYSKRSGSRETSYREQQLRQQQQEVSYDESYQNLQPGTRQYAYEDISLSRGHQQPPPLKRIPYNKAQHRPVVYPTSTTARYSIADTTTANPQHAYFTQQDEKLLDDVTKEYFTIFGQKLPGIQSTTPIYRKSSTTEKPLNTYGSTSIYKTGRPVTHKTPNVKVRYGDQSHRPYSLKDDTLVNHRRPLPPINPDSEFIEVIEPKPRPLTSLSDYESRTQNYRLRNHGPTSRYGVHTVQPTGGHTNNFVPLAESREELENVEEPVSLHVLRLPITRQCRPLLLPHAAGDHATAGAGRQRRLYLSEATGIEITDKTEAAPG